MKDGTWTSWKLAASKTVTQFSNNDYRYCSEVDSNTRFPRFSDCRVFLATVPSP
ncbi:hypothetical protein TGAMA5MH_02906 [Trichoderma gamsii]|uniref:Uncharacterized protein n=1 Tax=Trichoderma gamsii TaxID=398673 RepID=A0A2K0TJI3_9HYPO|nr:hypothetical protein TGAMA5MH_02906 [Trichoderma gamsii]